MADEHTGTTYLYIWNGTDGDDSYNPLSINVQGPYALVNVSLNTYGGNDTIYYRGVVYHGFHPDAQNVGLVADLGTGNDTFVEQIADVNLHDDYTATIDGGDGDDTITLKADSKVANTDTLYGGDGNDILTANKGNDILNGGEGNDILNGREGDDALNGGAGNDTLQVSSGSDTYNGDDGIDTISAASYTGGSVAIDLNASTLSLGSSSPTPIASIENATGSSANDTLKGNSAVNVLNGGGGNDVFYISGGSDGYYGGSGYDSISAVGQNSGVFIDLNLTKLALDISSAIGVPSPFWLQLVPKALSSIEGAQGSSHNDTLIGNSVRNLVYGENGNDTIQGLGGDDLLDGGEGNDTLDGGGGNDILHAGGGNDTLRVSTGSDMYAGDSGIDTISGEGYAGDVTINLNTSTLSLGGSSTGALIVAIENATGSSYNDTLTGNVLQNVLDGGDGNDALDGGGGDDTLKGGAGANTLRGGTGVDTFVFEVNSSNTVADFELSERMYINTTDFDNVTVESGSGVNTIKYMDQTIATFNGDGDFAVYHDASGTYVAVDWALA
jgi:Ca2+-binding RTX toxin-like protein